MHDPSLIIFASAVLLIAGTIKGFLGIGMPTVALAFLTMQLETRPAISLILVPMLVTNIWQFWRGPDMAGCLSRHWRFAAVSLFFVGVTVWLSQSSPDLFLRAMLGIIILIFCVTSWRNVVPPIPPQRVRLFEITGATISGLIGGLTAVWAPPMVIYLTGLRLERDDFVQALGLLITAGSIALVVTYPAVGHVTANDFWLSLFLLLPALIGFSVGERLRKQTDPERYKSIFLIAFSILGLNLLLGSLL